MLSQTWSQSMLESSAWMRLPPSTWRLSFWSRVAEAAELPLERRHATVHRCECRSSWQAQAALCASVWMKSFSPMLPPSIRTCLKPGSESNNRSHSPMPGVGLSTRPQRLASCSRNDDLCTAQHQRTPRASRLWRPPWCCSGESCEASASHSKTRPASSKKPWVPRLSPLLNLQCASRRHTMTSATRSIHFALQYR